jgi:hypothetical protein
MLLSRMPMADLLVQESSKFAMFNENTAVFPRQGLVGWMLLIQPRQRCLSSL